MDRGLSVASLAVGSVLALPAALFVGYFTDPAAALVVATGLLLPFATYAVVVDPDPPSLLPPRVVLGGACLLAVVAVVLSVQFDTASAGLLVSALAVGPALGYHGRYADDAGTLPAVLATGVLGTALVALVAVVADAPLAGGVAGASIAGATTWYLRERRLLTRRTRRAAAALALFGSVGVLVVGVLVEAAVFGIAGGTGLLVVGSALAVE